MKPKDLPALFSWETRRPYFHDGVLCVPKYFEKHKDFSHEIDSLFPNKQPLHIEFCSGNGEWIANKAEKYPEVNWVAVEMQFKRVRKIWSKKRNRNLKNLIVVCGMAQDFCSYYVEEGSVDQTYVNFPDPWPKKRHSKHRLIQTPFVDLLARIVKPEGKSTFVTDDDTYRDQMIEVLVKHEHFSSLTPKPYFEDKDSTYGSSYFNRLWEKEGKSIHYMNFKRVSYATV